MDIHEHQAKAVLKAFGAPVPRGEPAFSVQEAVKAAEDLGGPVWVVKAVVTAVRGPMVGWGKLERRATAAVEAQA